MVNTTWGADTIGNDWQDIPRNAPYVIEYVSGSNGVAWPSGVINNFSGRHVRCYQGYGPVPALNSFDEVDVESLAVTVQQAVSISKLRTDNGIQWTNIYGSRDSITQVAAGLKALGEHYWNGHVTCRLADWSLNEQQAAALVGGNIAGITIIGVQWASPESNPNTLVPGTQETLKASNIDLSVIDSTWIPSVGFGPVTPPPVVVSLEHIIAVYSDGSQKQVA